MSGPVEGMAEEATAIPATPSPSSPLGLNTSDMFKLEFDDRQTTLLIAGMATLLAANLCLSLVQEHVKHWKRGREQRAIIAIVFMVPLFAVDSYFGLADMPGSETVITVLDSVRACYEAFVISEFLLLLFSYMDISTDRNAPVPDTVKGKVLHNSFPMSLVLGEEMLVDRKTLNLLYDLCHQFMIVRPVFSALMCAALLLDVYHVSIVPWLFPIIFNVSAYLAFYSLLLFYHAFEHQLEKHKPLAKFLCIKTVVFLVFWQGLAIHLLVSYDIIHAGHMPFQVRQVEEATQNFVVCIEMLFAAVAFRYAYSASEYEYLSAEPAKPAATSAATAKKEPMAGHAKAGADASKQAPSASESKKAK